MQIADITINDKQVFWEDEFQWDSFEQKIFRCLDGGVAIQSHRKISGRNMTLQIGWISKSVLTEIEALRDASLQEPFQVTLPDLRFFNYVIFRHQDAPCLEITPIIEYNAFEPQDLLDVKLKLYIIG